MVLASLERDRVPPVRPMPGKEASKPKPVEFVSTGYADLDKLLYGGIASDSAVILTSPSCSERDQLIESFLETGAKKGEVAFYVTINPGLVKMLAVEYPSNLHLFVCNPQADAMVKDAPNVVKLRGVENLTEISIALTSAVHKLDSSLKDSRRICLGLISDVLLQHHAVQTRKWLVGFIPELQSEGFTILAIMDPEMHPSQEVRAILDLFDGEISIYEKETDKDRAKYLRIQRMSDQKYMEDEVILKKAEQTVLDKHRIAVLPFVNMSPDPNDEYFADGITEEIISTVSGISGLDVISRTSVMGYKGTTKKVEEIGRELEAGSILEGSFRKAGNRIRVTTQLIDVATDSHLWAQNYDRNLDDVFAVQSDVSKQVADALRVRILAPEKDRIEKRPTDSTKAYTLYLKGRYLWNKRVGERGFEDVEEAAKCFEQAVEEDPGFALGYVGLADCLLNIGYNWNIDFDVNLERAKVVVARALELDSNLAEAHATLGFALHEGRDLRESEEEFRKAIELKPGYASAHHWYFILLLSQLRWEEASEQIERAVELDPLSPVINWNQGSFYFFKREYARAIEPFRRAAELGNVFAHQWVAYCYGKMGLYDDMRREWATQVSLLQHKYHLVKSSGDSYMAYLENNREKLRDLLPELEASLEDGGKPGWRAWWIACIHFLLGDKDRGFEWLEKSYSTREQGLIYIKSDPGLDGIRTDPRYLDLLKRLGLDQTAQPTS